MSVPARVNPRGLRPDARLSPRAQGRAAELPATARSGCGRPPSGPAPAGRPQCFATLLTGRNPGANGIFDFFQFPAGGYERIPYSTRLLRHPFYQLLSAQGKRVGLLNVPLTFPFQEVNGFVVSGDERIGEEFAWPPDVARQLRQDGYFVPFGASYAPGRSTSLPITRCGSWRCAGAAVAVRRRPLGFRHVHDSSVWGVAARLLEVL
jgi:hypothetical protein